MSDRGFTDGMREGLRIPHHDDDTFKPTFGDLLKVLEIPGLLTDEEFARYRDMVRGLLGLGPYQEDEFIDPDTPLNDYDPEDYL